VANGSKDWAAIVNIVVSGPVASPSISIIKCELML
jgi:hypothetical protein